MDIRDGKLQGIREMIVYEFIGKLVLVLKSLIYLRLAVVVIVASVALVFSLKWLSYLGMAMVILVALVTLVASVFRSEEHTS